MGRKPKEQPSVTSNRAKSRCAPAAQKLIELVNGMAEAPDSYWEEAEREDPYEAISDKNMIKCVHQIAQFASLPYDMWRDYAKAVTGTSEEWDAFCQRLPVKFWRKWPELDPPHEWRWPEITYELAINDDGLLTPAHQTLLVALEGVEARRIRECRYCQRIFWASRIDMVACSKRCAGNLRARTF